MTLSGYRSYSKRHTIITTVSKCEQILVRMLGLRALRFHANHTSFWMM